MKELSIEEKAKRYDEALEEAKRWHKAEVICIGCKCRWISVRPVGTLLKDLECPQCGRRGSVIETGEVINENDQL